LHWDYNPSLTSSSGAVGPMQIIPRYAHKFAGRKLSVKELKNNIDLNVMVSMKMLRKWYSIYHDWTLACGAYNTGQPVRNSYAQYATSNTNYKNKWNKL
jgi:soluble lytic murein transglycosylase-like protein